MAIFFKETFRGSSYDPVIGTSPEINTGTCLTGLSWAIGDAYDSLKRTPSGSIYLNNTEGQDGSVKLRASTYPPGISTFELRMNVHIGPLTPSSYGRPLYTVRIGTGDITLAVFAKLEADGTTITHYTSNLDSTSISLSADTTYEIKFIVGESSQSFVINGQTLGFTETVTTTGLYELEIGVGNSGIVSDLLIGETSQDFEYPPETADADITAPTPVLLSYGSGGGGMSISPPTPTLQSASGAQALGLTAPSPRLLAQSRVSAVARAPALTAPSPTLRATAHNGYGEQAAFLTAPSPTLTITTGAKSACAAPSPALTATGTVTVLAKAALSAPVPTLIATGTVTELAAATLTAPSPNLVGYGGAVCSVSVTGSPTLQANVTVGGVASVAVTCPLFELTSTASIGNVASANLVAPSPELGRTIQAWLTAPSARLTAIGSAVVTATYEAYAVNLGHRPRVTNQELPIDEVTHYTNFPFTHVVRYQNSYYGANSTGLYLLEGTTDNGTPIPWSVKTAMDDFKTPVKKTVASAYFGGRFGSASTVQLHAGEDTPNTYSFSTPRDRLAQNHRQVFGKGVKERYFALGASGTGALELDTIELDTHNMTRRI